MIISMFLAHLVGDYVLQWDRLASWKSRELKGVWAHGTVVLIVTWLFTLPFDATWWQGVLFIGFTHILIDAIQLYAKPAIAPLGRFILDQAAHVIVIVFALTLGGYLDLAMITADLIQTIQNERLLSILLGYAFLTMPAWVIVKFTAYGLVKGSAPDFPGGSNKYIGILERLLITTFVALGQFLLVPLVTVPRLVFEWPQIADSEGMVVYIVELLGSIMLAVVIGILLSQL